MADVHNRIPDQEAGIDPSKKFGAIINARGIWEKELWTWFFSAFQIEKLAVIVCL